MIYQIKMKCFPQCTSIWQVTRPRAEYFVNISQIFLWPSLQHFAWLGLCESAQTLSKCISHLTLKVKYLFCFYSILIIVSWRVVPLTHGKHVDTQGTLSYRKHCSTLLPLLSLSSIQHTVLSTDCSVIADPHSMVTMSNSCNNQDIKRYNNKKPFLFCALRCLFLYFQDLVCCSDHRPIVLSSPLSMAGPGAHYYPSLFTWEWCKIGSMLNWLTDVSMFIPQWSPHSLWCLRGTVLAVAL